MRPIRFFVSSRFIVAELSFRHERYAPWLAGWGAAQLHHSWWGGGNRSWWVGAGGRGGAHAVGLTGWVKSLTGFRMNSWAGGRRHKVSDGRRFGVERCLLQLQLRWKQDTDRKQKGSGISWWVRGPKSVRTNQITSFLSIWKQCAVPLAVYWVEQVEREEQEKHQRINHTFN